MKWHEQNEQLPKIHRRGNRGRENCDRGRRASCEEGQHDEEHKTNIEPNIELNDSGSYYEKEVELNMGRFASTYESTADSEYSNILTMESPINS
ncbi:hypothetical protein F8M41_002693 [Gigaspora margarita]|uniref:Uncharacterized protein n=1 Tax=Gigaspora margarita TaxID=4874 RepID=A0A8H4AYI4_GIGMA|nr:hypothetical protein F8M41_002693 [Gigaspora margarita]